MSWGVLSATEGINEGGLVQFNLLCIINTITRCGLQQFPFSSKPNYKCPLNARRYCDWKKWYLYCLIAAERIWIHLSWYIVSSFLFSATWTLQCIHIHLDILNLPYIYNKILISATFTFLLYERWGAHADNISILWYCRWSPRLLSINTDKIEEGWCKYTSKTAKDFEHSRERVGVREWSDCWNLEEGCFLSW